MEVATCARLFGGKRELAQRVREECTELGVQALSWAPTSLAAVALARSGLRNGFAFKYKLRIIQIHIANQVSPMI